MAGRLFQDGSFLPEIDASNLEAGEPEGLNRMELHGLSAALSAAQARGPVKQFGYVEKNTFVKYRFLCTNNLHEHTNLGFFGNFCKTSNLLISALNFKVNFCKNTF